jgi:microcystin-dependent protein
MHIVNTDIAVNEDYPKAYTTRTLAPGQGSEGDEAYSWDDFTTLACTKDIKASLDALAAEVHAITQEPYGIVKMWAGTSIPEGYHLCDGTALLQSQYPVLFAAIGTSFNTANDKDGNAYSTSAGYFRLPDLRGRFIVGMSQAGYDYNTIGDTGGKKEVQLTQSEMPSHSNIASYRNSGDDEGRVTEPYIAGAGYDADGRTQSNTINISNTGGSQPHENRPPYYVLAYIMKID